MYGIPDALIRLLLRHLGAQVAAVGKPVAADDRQRDVMLDAGSGFGGEQIAARRLEELQHRLVLERRRVRQVDDDLRARQRFGQPLAGDGVDARGGRRRHDLMALLTQAWPPASFR